MSDDQIEYEKVILEDEYKGLQLKLTVSIFKGEYYLGIRKYFLDINGEYNPSKEGVSFIMSIDNTTNLAEGLLEIISKAEGKAIIQKFYDKFNN